MPDVIDFLFSFKIEVVRLTFELTYRWFRVHVLHVLTVHHILAPLAILTRFSDPLYSLIASPVFDSLSSTALNSVCCERPILNLNLTAHNVLSDGEPLVCRSLSFHINSERCIAFLTLSFPMRKATSFPHTAFRVLTTSCESAY